MNTYTYKRNKPEDGEIVFPALQCWNPATKVATIVAEVSGKRIACRIRISDLRKKFNIFPDDPMQSVTENRESIENAARRLIENKMFEDDGSILVQYKDLN